MKKKPTPKPLRNAIAAPPTPKVVTPQLPPPGSEKSVPAKTKEPVPVPAVPIGCVRFQKGELQDILAGLAPVIRSGRRGTLPVLSHIFLASQNGRVTVEATDLTTRAVHTTPAPVANSDLARRVLEARFLRENGAFLVPYDEIRQIAKAASKDEAIILQGFGGPKPFTPHHVTASYILNSAPITREMPSLPTSQFPDVKALPFTDEMTVVPDTLAAVRHAMDVSSHDDTRYVLNGVALDGSKKGHHCIIGTDGRRLFNHNSQTFPFKGVQILPACAVTRPLSPLLMAPGWKLAFAAPEKKGGCGSVRITTGPWVFTTKAIEGNYPNWRQVLPAPESFRAKIVLPLGARDYLLKTIPALPGKVESIRIQTGHPVTVHQGTNIIVVPGATSEGKDVTVTFNSDFFMDALRQNLGTLNLIDEMSPGVFTEGPALHVLMPIRRSA